MNIATPSTPINISALSKFPNLATATADEGAKRWSIAALTGLFELPFADLMFRAQEVHRAHHAANKVQLSTLLSIKTGGCPEDCGYCSQSARHGEAERESLLDLDEVIAAAQAAKEGGASRFCMGAAWRGPKDRDIDNVAAMISAVKGLGLETCVTLGMLKDGQAARLKDAGLDYYNHNLDTAPEFYGQVISTHSQQDRFDTLGKVREAGIKVCCGGIVGMGETRAARISLLAELANMETPPESVPINNLIPMPGTPLADAPPIDPFEFVRMIAVARISMPESMVRLSAGPTEMNDELQSLCFLAGANSIFYGDKLLTGDNPEATRDTQLFGRLGIQPA